MPIYEVRAGYRIDSTTGARLLAEGISAEIMGHVVRVLNVEYSTNDTIFTIDAGSEEIANDWRNLLKFDLGSMDLIELPVVEDPDPLPFPLDVWVKVGQWTKTAGVSTTTISSLPSTPKGAIFWGSGLAGAAMGTYNDAGAVVLGYSDGTNNRSLGFACQDDQVTTNANRSLQLKAFHLVDPAGDITGHIKEGCTIGFNATSLDMNWDATTNATVGHYFIFGGDDIEDVQVKDFEYGTTDSTIHEYTGLGDQYNFGLFIIPYVAGPLPWMNGGLINASHSISAIGGTRKQRCWTTNIRNQDNVNPSSTHRLQKRARMLSTMGSTTNIEQQYCKFVEWTDDGFKLDWLNPPSGAVDFFSGLFVKGGSWDAGYFNQPTTVSTIRTLLVNKHDIVQGVMGFSIGQTDQTFKSVGTSPAKFGIGAEDTDGNRGTITYAGNNNDSPSQEATIMLNDKFMRSINATATASSSTTTGECTISDLDTRGEFTVDYTTADGIVRQVLFFTLSA